MKTIQNNPNTIEQNDSIYVKRHEIIFEIHSETEDFSAYIIRSKIAEQDKYGNIETREEYFLVME